MKKKQEEDWPVPTVRALSIYLSIIPFSCCLPSPALRLLSQGVTVLTVDEVHTQKHTHTNTRTLSSTCQLVHRRLESNERGKISGSILAAPLHWCYFQFAFPASKFPSNVNNAHGQYPQHHFGSLKNERNEL